MIVHQCPSDKVLEELGHSQGKVGRNASMDIEVFWGGVFVIA